MKKRKKPVLLLTVLAVFVGIVGVINAMSASRGDEHGEQVAAAPPPSMPATGEARSGVSKDDLAAATQSSLAARGTVPGPDAAAADTGPKIADPRRAAAPPMPHNSTMGSGWYTDEAPKSYTTKGTKGRG